MAKEPRAPKDGEYRATTYTFRLPEDLRVWINHESARRTLAKRGRRVTPADIVIEAIRTLRATKWIRAKLKATPHE